MTTTCPPPASAQQLVPSRANALGKRSRMRMGLPEYYNCVLERPAATAPGYDLIHIDVRLPPNLPPPSRRVRPGRLPAKDLQCSRAV